MKNIVLLTGHGGTENLRDIKEGLKAFLRLEKAYKDLAIYVVGVCDFSPTLMGYFSQHDYHAALVETSLILHLCPDQVRKEWVTDKKEVFEMMLNDPDSYQVFEKHTLSEFELPHVNQHKDIEVGVMGYPEKANAELGKKIFEESVSGLAKFVQEISGK